MRRTASFILICAAALSMAQAPTTCSLDPVFTASNKKGIYPDSLVNFVDGIVGQPYGQNITVKVPKDTTQSGFTICFNRIELSTPTGYTNFNLPPGLNLLAGPTVTTSAGIYKYPGDANSCSVISGTPTIAGTYTIQFKVQPFLTPSFTGCASPPNYNSGSGSIVAPTVLSYYIIKIIAATGVREELTAGFLKLTANPNPFSRKTVLKFNVKDEAPAKISVYSLLGNKIYEDRITTKYGENSYELNAEGWNSGIYFYTIQYKNHSETKRMVLTNSN